MTLLSSNFLRTGRPDTRLAQTATASLDATARQVLDQQIVDLQTILSLLLVNGILGTYGVLDASYTDADKGDVVCLGSSSATTIVRAQTLPLSGAGCVFGVLLEAVPAGARALIAIAGVLDSSITGLATGSPGPVRVSSVGRCEQVASFLAGDFGLGAVDSNGRLTLIHDSGAFASAGSVSFNAVRLALAAASLSVSFNSQKITDLATPTAGTDAATKAYVDSTVGAAYTNGDGLNLAAGAFSVIYGLVGEVGNVSAGDVAAAGTIKKAAAVDHKHAVNSTPTPTADKLVAYGSSAELKGAWFQTNSTVASSGILRCASNSTPVAARTSGGNTAKLVDWSVTDDLTIGDSVRAATVQIDSATGNRASIGGNPLVDITSKGIGLGGAIDAGAGEIVVFIKDATTVPSSAPTGGNIIYGDSGTLKNLGANGVFTTLAPLATAATTWVYDWKSADVRTTNATPTTILTITVPDSVVGRITYSVMAKSSDNCNWYERTVRVRHNGTDAVLVETLTPSGIADREDIGAGCDITVSQTGDNIVLDVTGIGATTIDWTVSAKMEFYRA